MLRTDVEFTSDIAEGIAFLAHGANALDILFRQHVVVMSFATWFQILDIGFLVVLIHVVVTVFKIIKRPDRESGNVKKENVA